jgi:CYTH domain-containing protein
MMYDRNPNQPMTEIERKFLVSKMPAAVEMGEPRLIEQGYIIIGTDGSEVRLRRKKDRYYLTVKRGVGLSRRESEVELTPDQFQALWPATEGLRLEKERFEIPYGGLVIELDVFQGDLENLILAEVEFDSIDASESFEIPTWFGEEVTGDPRYMNQSLARNGKAER